MNIREFSLDDSEAVIRLWEECGLVVPWNDPAKDLARKMTAGADLFLVGEINDEIMASAMGGYDGHRGWVNYLAVKPELQKEGFGKQLMDEIERRLKEKGCPKINLQIRTSNDAVRHFYEAIGYKQDDVVSYGKRLIPDD